jgi:hypothetical protein
MSSLPGDRGHGHRATRVLGGSHDHPFPSLFSFCYLLPLGAPLSPPDLSLILQLLHNSLHRGRCILHRHHLAIPSSAPPIPFPHQKPPSSFPVPQPREEGRYLAAHLPRALGWGWEDAPVPETDGAGQSLEGSWGLWRTGRGGA